MMEQALAALEMRYRRLFETVQVEFIGNVYPVDGKMADLLSLQADTMEMPATKIVLEFET
jgi:hypothetical protein